MRLPRFAARMLRMEPKASNSVRTVLCVKASTAQDMASLAIPARWSSACGLVAASRLQHQPTAASSDQLRSLAALQPPRRPPCPGVSASSPPRQGSAGRCPGLPPRPRRDHLRRQRRSGHEVEVLPCSPSCVRSSVLLSWEGRTLINAMRTVQRGQVLHGGDDGPRLRA